MQQPSQSKYAACNVARLLESAHGLPTIPRARATARHDPQGRIRARRAAGRDPAGREARSLAHPGAAGAGQPGARRADRAIAQRRLPDAPLHLAGGGRRHPRTRRDRRLRRTPACRGRRLAPAAARPEGMPGRRRPRREQAQHGDRRLRGLRRDERPLPQADHRRLRQPRAQA